MALHFYRGMSKLAISVMYSLNEEKGIVYTSQGLNKCYRTARPYQLVGQVTA